MKMEKCSMRELVMAVGGPLPPGENRKRWLARVAQIAGLSPRVAAAAFYGETSSRTVAEKLKKAAGKYEAENLARQFEHLAESLQVRDEDFYRAHADTWRDIARSLRALARANGGEVGS